MDDFASVWRLGHAGLGRNDSESQFADLLKSFPSTNSLGGEAGGNGGGNEAGGTGGDAAQQGAAGGGDGASGGRVGVSEGNGGGMGGMPRVASLEFLKQFLVAPQQLAQSAPGAKKDAGEMNQGLGIWGVEGGVTMCEGGRVGNTLSWPLCDWNGNGKW